MPRRRINWRTPVLALLATGTLVWSAITQFDIPVEEMGSMLLMSVLFLGVLIAAALTMLLLWKLPGWVIARRRERDTEAAPDETG